MKAPASLVYSIHPGNGGVVFATPERAARVDRIHKAIGIAETWGEFRRAMPREEYSTIIRTFDEIGESRPRSADAFNPSHVPGFDEGDYPPWLQQEMGKVLPPSVLAAFATRKSSVINGSYWMIPESSLPDVLKTILSLGISVSPGGNMKFY